MTDSSNLSGEYARNRLRLEVLPVLEELNPGFLQAVSRMVETLRQDQDFLEAQARDLLEQVRLPWGLDGNRLAASHPSLRSRALELYWEEREPGSLEKRHLDALARCISRGGEADLPGGVRAQCSQGVFSLEKPERPRPFSVEAGLGETVLPAARSWFCGKKRREPGRRRQKFTICCLKTLWTMI